MAPGQHKFRIGVDVGGTNTDGVILDPSPTSDHSRGILAWHKSITTSDPSDGIKATLATLFASAQISPDDIASVTIGTTYFINAVVARDRSRLSRVAVLRLCGPFSKHVPPCVDWPHDLRAIILGYSALVKGGLEVDGSLISDIDADEIRGHCAEIRNMGLRTVVINGVFSPIDTENGQEDRAAAIVRSEIPGCDVVCSRQVANLGFLERENCAILNAAILRFARSTIRSFFKPIRALGLYCPLFISQNDGTSLSAGEAMKLPVRTFSSGPTNSMRGAAFLAEKDDRGRPAMVVDIGGTTTDVGLLEANGFPRQRAAYSDFAGIRMNFSCPDVKSIGLGGGSVVQRGLDGLRVGPQSVGKDLQQEGTLFGGDVLTATDFAAHLDSSLSLGNRQRLEGCVSDKDAALFSSTVKSMIERIIDTMKTSPDDIDVLLVGGGAIIAPSELKGALKVTKPTYYEVANAIGAATAGVSAVVDTIRSTTSRTASQIAGEIQEEAKRKTIEAGALESSVRLVESEFFPLPYIADKSRFVVKCVGDFDTSRVDNQSSADPEIYESQEDTETPVTSGAVRVSTEKSSSPIATEDPLTYKPEVKKRTWYINETDLQWITTGCYILGTGGGGSPYAQMILLRQKLRAGAVVRVMSPRDLPDDALVGSGGGAGSPTVSIEKLSGDEMLQAQHELYKILGSGSGSGNNPAHSRRSGATGPTHVIAVEIGGANGLQSLILGASTALDVPAVDGDWMGRAYPTKWQTTPVVFDERSPVWCPVVMADGNGNVVAMPAAASDQAVERVMRAALAEMGSQVGFADPPVSGAEARRWVVENTISLSWRIGRAVAAARVRREGGGGLDQVAERIVEACGGEESARVLWKGKIVGVERTLRKGHVYGECIVEGIADHQPGSDTGTGREAAGFTGRIKIPFKNENIAAIRIDDFETSNHSHEPQKERQEDVLAIVPDLVCVIDALSGEAIGTPEYRYGLLVVVLGIAASDRWTGTARGIEIGGPRAFGFDHLEYRALGRYTQPRSVIDEFNIE